MKATVTCMKCGAELRGACRWDTCASCLANAARARLCEVGWSSAFAYLRRRGYEMKAAQDRTHEFLARQLTSGALEMVERGEGRLRLLVKGALHEFISSGMTSVAARRQESLGSPSQNAEAAEAQYRNLPADLTPDQVFDKQWAMALHRRVAAAIEDAAASSKSRDWFEALKGYMTESGDVRECEDLAARLNTTEGPIKRYVGRLRHHFGNELIREIMETVGRPEDMVDEKRVIFDTLGSGKQPLPVGGS